MGVLEPRMTLTCYVVGTTYDKHGDLTFGSETATSCWFRDISALEIANNAEYANIDSMIWLPASASVSRGSIIKYDSVYYRIETITKAKRLGESTVQFQKCLLSKANK